MAFWLIPILLVHKMNFLSENRDLLNYKIGIGRLHFLVSKLCLTACVNITTANTRQQDVCLAVNTAIAGSLRLVRFTEPKADVHKFRLTMSSLDVMVSTAATIFSNISSVVIPECATRAILQDINSST